MPELAYIVALDRGEGLAWARQNKPRSVPKCFSAHNHLGPRGLRIKDQPVYVLNPIPQDVRDAWIATGGRLVYL